MKDRKFSIFIEWGYDRKGPYENCVIRPTELDDYDFNGTNYVSKGGSEGMDFFICDSLKEAIIKSQFNPSYITFLNLTSDELLIKNDLIKELCPLFAIDMKNNIPQF